MNPQASDARGFPRTSMFVGATLRRGEATTPVKLRNMSESGVMIEGVEGLAVGSEINIQRGRLAAVGTVVWSAGRQTGVRFRYPERVDIWLKPIGSVQQHQVDEVIRQWRAGEGESVPFVHATPAVTQARVPEIIRLLSELEDALTADVLVLAQHGDKLQNLDLALQLLRQLR
ncbi:PilZ domain-containing protein [Sphingomonas ginkgonis]|uniref:PilZ domain-containing protein n=1 Tax=Sphingomonas ginkgonis TaxID=2315330 RepID=A0A3R9Z5S0_9SPHN|nr:PilZ domain-containing protein [Sphingomonas ginkgonis]RST30410.1 PilZ domain-containing protein [Sphingomonas ginkgonis]